MTRNPALRIMRPSSLLLRPLKSCSRCTPICAGRTTRHRTATKKISSRCASSGIQTKCRERGNRTVGRWKSSFMSTETRSILDPKFFRRAHTRKQTSAKNKLSDWDDLSLQIMGEPIKLPATSLNLSSRSCGLHE